MIRTIRSRMLPVLLATAAMLLAAGCEDVYEIDVTPEGDSIQRVLTCWHVDHQNQIRPIAQEKLDRIGKFYTVRKATEDGKKHLFAGRFIESTPPELGGAGCYLRFRSRLGDAFCYVERFGSNDDPEATLARQRAAADRLVDLLLGWLESQLSCDPRFAQLKRFMDIEARRDLKNLGLYGWAGDVATSAKGRDDGEPLIRALLYLWERDYIRRSELGGLARAIAAADQERLVRYAQRFVARRMGVLDDQPIPSSLAFLSSRRRQKESVEAYIRTTEVFRQRLAQWQLQRKDNPDLQEPQPEDLLGELLAEVFGPYRFLGPTLGSRERVVLRLGTGVAPLQTNGRWDEKAKAVVFEGTLYPHRAIPAFFFAVWSTPDQRFQRTHFGRVLLDGGDLAHYVLWYCTLSEEEAEQWDRFLSALKPGADIPAAVKEFRFAGDPSPNPFDPDSTPPSWADEAKRLLLQALSRQR